MFRLTRSQVQPIGLDIGHDSIKMLQVEIIGDQTLSVRAAARQALPDEARQQPQLRLALAADLVRQMIRQNGFVGRHVVTTLPREIVHAKNLRLPQIPSSELASAVEFEARNIFAFDTDDAQVRHMPAGEVRQGMDVKQEVIVMGARNEDVNNYLEQLHRCGVIVDSLDLEPCALYRSIERFMRRREDEQEAHVLADVGLLRSHVVIGKGREISFIKPIDIGGRHLNEAVSRKLAISLDEARGLRRRLAEAPEAGAPPAPDGKRDAVRQAVYDATRSTMEELGREISLCLRYYSVTFRGHRPARLRLVGGEASDPQLGALLNAALTIPVEAGRPLFSVDTSRMKPSDRRGTMSEWALAFGLSLKTTSQYFKPRDGKPRDPNEPRHDLEQPQQSIGEVVDLNKMLDPAARSSTASAELAEAAHA
jgi:type IV pilus assembly protein PilM